MDDMKQVIIPKSDQLNADDLLSGPITIKISGVSIRPGTEQPISVSYEGDKGKPWKPCKSMARVMVSAWGPDSSKYAGRTLTLYTDPKVKWGGMEVGGLRISHMSDIDSAITMALTVTRANKKPYTVRPLKSQASDGAEKGTAAADVGPSSDSTANESPATPDAAAYITVDQALNLESLCTDNEISVDSLKKKANVSRISLILAADYDRALAWVNATIAKRKESHD